jgi:hypothetical protein
MSTSTNTKTIWDLLENPPIQAAETAALLEWSMNFDHKLGATPYTIFLDLIGYSADNIGCPLSSLDNIHRVLGYMELDYLGDALKEYADNPKAVSQFIDDIQAAEETSA